MVSKYYVVVSGKVPGIYTDLKTTQNMINNYPGAFFKSFTTLKEAKKFYMDNANSNNDLPINSKPLLEISDKTHIYINSNSKGFGIVIITKENKKITAKGHISFDLNETMEELYTIYVALSLVSGNVVIYTTSKAAINCLTQHADILVDKYDLVKSILFCMKNRSVSFVLNSSGAFYDETIKLSQEGCNTKEIIIYD